MPNDNKDGQIEAHLEGIIIEMTKSKSWTQHPTKSNENAIEENWIEEKVLLYIFVFNQSFPATQQYDSY